MRRKASGDAGPTPEEIVGGQGRVRRRPAQPQCVMLMKGKERRGILDPFAGVGHLTLSAYTRHVALLLRRIFGGNRQVVVEWNSMREEAVRSPRTGRRRLYSPEVDIAVGPFAILRSYMQEYDRLAALHADLLGAMRQAFQMNLRVFGSSFKVPSLGDLCSHNLNARCFMALEIERGNNDLKHLIGSMEIASSLGRVGLVVAWDRRRLRDLLRPRETWGEWGGAGKNTFNAGNLFWLTRGQTVRILTRFAQSIVASPPCRPWAPRPSSRRR